jgi:hypothetical protein
VETTGNGPSDFPPGDTVYTGVPIGGSTSGSGPTGFSNATNYTAQLFALGSGATGYAGAATAFSSLQPLPQYTSTFVPKKAGAGLFIGSSPPGDPGIPNSASGVAALSLAVWYNSNGDIKSLADAQAANVPYGWSPVFVLNGLGNLGVPPTVPPYMLGLTSFSLINPTSPLVSIVAMTNMVENTALTVPFTVANMPAGFTNVVATVSNPNLVSAVDITGSGGNFNLTIHLLPSAVGNANITLAAWQNGASVASAAVNLTVTPPDTLIVPVINWVAPSPITYGTPLSSIQQNATSIIPGSFTYNPAPGSILNAGTNVISALFTPNDTVDYQSVTATTSLIVAQAAPTVTFPVLHSAIFSYGTPLTSVQLCATANVPGAFQYTPPAGAILDAGSNFLSVLFIPTDTNDYQSVVATTNILVTAATPVITWPAPTPIPYGTPLTSNQLNATANTPGIFTYTPTNGALLEAGTNILSVQFTPSNSNDFQSTTATAQIVVNPTTPLITWPTPAAITYGTPLTSNQLNATANIAGLFTYTPTNGALLEAGTSILSVQFTPSNSAYQSTTATAQIVVTSATPLVTWPTPPPITYGTPLSSNQLNATANTAGLFTYTPTNGAMLEAGTNTLSVQFTPSNTNDFQSTTATAQIVVTPATSLVIWATPPPITYGTPLTSSQLNATANTPGIFTYTPTNGAMLESGTNTLSVQFTPSNTNDFQSTTATAQIVVTPATSLVIWATPPPITYGTPLTSSQLNATANTPGIFTYTPTNGAMLESGTNILSVQFTPSNTKDYQSATATAQIVVTPATPLVTWPTPPPITYGTPLTSNQLNATANIPGLFTYTPTNGALLEAGTNILSVQFTPSNSNDYQSTTATAQIVVNPATPLITWPTPAAIAYGAPLTSSQLNATANTPGLFTYTPANGALLEAGTNTLSVQFTPSNTNDFQSTTATAQIVVTPATPLVTWPTPPPITYGTPLASNQLNATANTAGLFTYTPTNGAMLEAGTNTLSVQFTPSNTNDFQSTTATAQIVVTPATPLVTWPTPPPITYGTPLTSNQLNATANTPGLFTYTPTNGALLEAGTNILSVQFTPSNSNDYQSTTATAQIVVNPATPLITWPTPAAIAYGAPLTSNQLNATANIPGIFTYTPTNGALLEAGTNTLSVQFTPANTNDFQTAIATVTISIIPSDVSLQLTPAPSGQAVVLRFSTASGVNYILQSTSDWNANWQTITSIVGDGSLQAFTNLITNSQRFYRIKW